MANIGAWIGGLSALVTTVLTILNAVWSRDIQSTDQRLKVKASELEQKRVELETLSASLAEPPNLEKLSAEGRVNVLYFLKSADPAAWTPDLIKRADSAIANIKSRHDSGAAAVGSSTREMLNQVSTQLEKIRKP